MSDELLNKIDLKVDKISDDITDIKIVQARQETVLEEHIKRSDSLENLYNHLSAEVHPLKSDVEKIKGAFQLFTVLASVIASILGFLKLFGKM